MASTALVVVTELSLATALEVKAESVKLTTEAVETMPTAPPDATDVPVHADGM